MWCFGSSCCVGIEDDRLVSGIYNGSLLSMFDVLMSRRSSRNGQTPAENSHSLQRALLILLPRTNYVQRVSSACLWVMITNHFVFDCTKSWWHQIPCPDQVQEEMQKTNAIITQQHVCTSKHFNHHIHIFSFLYSSWVILKAGLGGSWRRLFRSWSHLSSPPQHPPKVKFCTSYEFSFVGEVT